MDATRQLKELIECRRTWQECSEAVRSWARLHIHHLALEIMENPEAKHILIAKVPKMHRDRVMAECQRLHLLNIEREENKSRFG